MQGEVRTHPSIECLRGRSFGALLRVTMENAAASSSSPVVPGLADSGAIQTKNVQVQDAPIQAATVFTRNRAEITRLLAMPSPAKIGLHEVGVDRILNVSRSTCTQHCLGDDAIPLERLHCAPCVYSCCLNFFYGLVPHCAGLCDYSTMFSWPMTAPTRLV